MKAGMKNFLCIINMLACSGVIIASMLEGFGVHTVFAALMFVFFLTWLLDIW